MKLRRGHRHHVRQRRSPTGVRGLKLEFPLLPWQRWFVAPPRGCAG